MQTPVSWELRSPQRIMFTKDHYCRSINPKSVVIQSIQSVPKHRPPSNALRSVTLSQYAINIYPPTSFILSDIEQAVMTLNVSRVT